jgi:hypothetical protein
LKKAVSVLGPFFRAIEMKVTEALVEELAQQGFADGSGRRKGSIPWLLAKVVIKAADRDVVPLRSNRRSTDR